MTKILPNKYRQISNAKDNVSHPLYHPSRRNSFKIHIFRAHDNNILYLYKPSKSAHVRYKYHYQKYGFFIRHFKQNLLNREYYIEDGTIYIGRGGKIQPYRHYKSILQNVKKPESIDMLVGNDNTETIWSIANYK